MVFVGSIQKPTGLYWLFLFCTETCCFLLVLLALYKKRSVCFFYGLLWVYIKAYLFLFVFMDFICKPIVAFGLYWFYVKHVCFLKASIGLLYKSKGFYLLLLILYTSVQVFVHLFLLVLYKKPIGSYWFPLVFIYKPIVFNWFSLV